MTNELAAMDQIQKENRSILKTVAAAVLIAMLWKVRYFWLMDQWIVSIPLQDESFFPWMFRNQSTARQAYLLACGAAAALLLVRQQQWLTILASAQLVFVVTLNIHQSGYNDVTFLLRLGVCMVRLDVNEDRRTHSDPASAGGLVGSCDSFDDLSWRCDWKTDA